MTYEFHSQCIDIDVDIEEEWMMFPLMEVSVMQTRRSREREREISSLCGWWCGDSKGGRPSRRLIASTLIAVPC